ncbi:MAG: hypothetical protein AAFQ58_06400 [Pseudomonadota bacterium]
MIGDDRPTRPDPIAEALEASDNQHISTAAGGMNTLTSRALTQVRLNCSGCDMSDVDGLKRLRSHGIGHRTRGVNCTLTKVSIRERMIKDRKKVFANNYLASLRQRRDCAMASKQL